MYEATSLNSRARLPTREPQVHGVRALTDLRAADRFSPAELTRLIASAAASYVAAHVLGVRDRHSDNILIASDGAFVSVFCNVVGQYLGRDAGDARKLCTRLSACWHSGAPPVRTPQPRPPAQSPCPARINRPLPLPSFYVAIRHV